MDPLVRNRVTVTGNRKAARTLVFVHGFGTDQFAWAGVAGEFERDWRIVLLDNAGTGRSPPEAFVQHRYLTLRAYATDLLEVCAALDLNNAVAVGHSAGAMICALAALERPPVFSRLVMINASPRYLDEPGYRGGFDEAALELLYRAVTLQYSQWADEFAPLAMANPDRPVLAQRFAESLKSISADNALTVLCSIFQSDHRKDVERLRLPTLIIQSRTDIAVPREVADWLHAAIAGSRLEIIDAEGHLPHLSAPQAVVAAMQGFLDPGDASAGLPAAGSPP
jgi:sigma-B regulation protein RsbQ